MCFLRNTGYIPFVENYSPPQTMTIYPPLRAFMHKFTGLRRHLGHNQADWGDALGKDASSISRIENLRSPIKVEHLLRIAEKHQFPPEHFFQFNPDTGQLLPLPDVEKEQLRRENAALRNQLAHQTELIERLKKDAPLAGGGGRANVLKSFEG